MSNKVYNMKAYDNTCTGCSNGRSNLLEQELLPVGMCNYVLNLVDGSESRGGWLYINK